MLRKKRSRQKLPSPEISIYSLMDIVATLLFFLLWLGAFAGFQMVPSSSLISGESQSNSDKPVFTLQIMVKGNNAAYVWLGPIEKLQVVNERRLRDYLSKRFQGSANLGFFRKLETTDLRTLNRKLQEILIEIKRGFPGEQKAVIAFTDGVTYQNLIDVLSSVRELDEKAEPYQVLNQYGQKEMTRVLFPTIVISEWDETGA